MLVLLVLCVWMGVVSGELDNFMPDVIVRIHDPGWWWKLLHGNN